MPKIEIRFNTIYFLMLVLKILISAFY